MKYDRKNALKLQISTYLEEALGMVGNIMLEELFDKIENMTENEGKELVEAHYDQNVFELIAPYLQKAEEEYNIYKRTPEGKLAMDELKQLIDTTDKLALNHEMLAKAKLPDDSGNVH